LVKTKNNFRIKKDNLSHIPWRSMAGLRDVVVHEYDDLDFRTVRDIVEKELPTVLEDLLPLLPPENL
jgi:uncharacterized protein with HEPN domain